MIFIDRFEEREFFEKILNSNKKEVFVLYGRRRIGKSFLLKEVTKNKNILYYTARKISPKEQLKTFSNKVGEFLKFGKISFENWEDAFRVLFEYSNRESIIMVLDEFQYLVEKNQEILSILQLLIDEFVSSKMKLILCGSSISFMEGILSYNNPLYGRKTGNLKLNPIAFKDINLFIPDNDYHSLMTIYSIIGGIPYYLQLWNSQLDILKNIENLFLTLGAPLKEEPYFILTQELRETSIYQSILEAVASGKTRINEITSFIGETDSRRIQPYLKSLQLLKIVKREYPAFTKNPHRIKNFIYKIDDQLFNFWYRYIFPHKDSVDLNDYSNVIEIIKNDLTQYVSFEFEKQSIIFLKEKFNLAEAGNYWNKNIEIDMLGKDFENKIYAAEIKWRNRKMNIKDFYNLKFKTEKSKISVDNFILVSKSGFEENLISLAKEEKITLIEFTKEKGWKIVNIK
ncbi:ATP-binding protein [Marinitoga sp. 1138]|uniref:ATP-binding protein n=1 Tax=Marinitoga sp. 1138 TaxID=1643334 RepID=UPI0034C6D41A